MINVTIEDELAGHVEKFPGNPPAERWMAYRPREAGDVGTYPARRRGFRTRKAAVDWLLENVRYASYKATSERWDAISEERKAQMSLDRALHLLARVHTRDDDQIGFVVVAGATAEAWGNGVSQVEYIEAWRTVRKHLHLPTEPPSDMSDERASEKEDKAKN
ncbi:hypothetical protein KGO5_01710 [Sinorhizobium sp. KGO-5]|uniref:hypothetical protein n=1 Tax=Sinorhizobium sp. KGO-5 TaxID=1470810 RepID=UPI00294A3787|nr:hypothetical protein KGO5_01710 [Sinorhizobium sp. KGO-5]